MDRQCFTDWHRVSMLFIGLLFNVVAAQREVYNGRRPMWIISVLEQAALRLRAYFGEDWDRQLDVMRQNLAQHDPYYHEAAARLADATQAPFHADIPEEEEGVPVTMIFPDGRRLDGMMEKGAEDDGKGAA